jgi:hypothetical protein
LCAAPVVKLVMNVFLIADVVFLDAMTSSRAPVVTRISSAPVV